MKFSRIYRETKLLWPKAIDISDGELMPDNGGTFPTLSKVWDGAEAGAESWSEWHQLMVWCIFCGLHKLARKSLENGQVQIRLIDVDKAYIQSKYQEDLFSIDAGYGRQMKRAYVNDLKP